MIPELIYCDGGVIGPNPSKLGGTWSWCWVDKGAIVKREFGIVTPEDIWSPDGVDHKGSNPAVTNNQTELYAAMKALSSVPRSWDGILWTDSRITLLRVTTSNKFNGIPNWMRNQILSLRTKSKY